MIVYLKKELYLLLLNSSTFLSKIWFKEEICNIEPQSTERKWKLYRNLTKLR